MQALDRRDPPYLDSYRVEAIIKNERLPNPLEVANNFLRHLARTSSALGEAISLEHDAIASIIGVANPAAVGFLKQQFQQNGLLHDNSDRGETRVALTLRGWDRFAELEREAVGSKTAFMAMKFNEPTLNRMYEDHFKAAVLKTGFDLRNLGEDPPAGLIDNRLRVEIRNSRFLIADLTHGSNGAYWEAGFAEGLGKPVIYTCERSVFEDPQKRTHFDTNHHHTVVWDSQDPGKSVKDLKATIRATLPAEAQMED